MDFGGGKKFGQRKRKVVVGHGKKRAIIFGALTRKNSLLSKESVLTK